MRAGRKKGQKGRNGDLGPDLAQRVVRLYDPAVVNEMDQVALLLAARWPMSHVPELYELLGKDGLLQFIRMFSGMVLRIPALGGVEEAIKEHRIYQDILFGWSVEEIQKKYGVSDVQVYRIHCKMREFYATLRRMVLDPPDQDDQQVDHDEGLDGSRGESAGDIIDIR